MLPARLSHSDDAWDQFLCRYPDEAYIIEIARMLRLSDQQAAKLRYAISDLVQSMQILQLAKERFGPDSVAVAGLRRISKDLTAAERDLRAADTIIMELLNSGYVKRLDELANARNDPWYKKLFISYPGKYNDDLKHGVKPYDDIFKPAKKREEHVLDTIRNVNSATADLVKTLGRKRVGSPGRVYRNAALEKAIGLDVCGLDKAVAQVLKEMRTRKSRPSPQSTPKKGQLFGTPRRP